MMTRKLAVVVVTMLTFIITVFVLCLNTVSTRQLPAEKLSSMIRSSSRELKYWEPKNAATSQKYVFNCTNIHQIQIIKRDLRNGRPKAVDIGMFNGKKVVIKRISTLTQTEISDEYRQLLFLKEILMRDLLNHTGIIRMLGYCVSSIVYDGFINIPGNEEILAVYEYGDNFDASNMSFSVDNRLKHALELSQLLLYLKNSPLGSLMIKDFKSEHFLMVNGQIKLIDLDYMHNIEYPCDVTATKPWCPHKVKCHKVHEPVIGKCENKSSCSSGVCTGSIAEYNMAHINKALLKYFIQPIYFPAPLRDTLAKVLSELTKQTIEPEDLVKELKIILQNYERFKQIVTVGFLSYDRK